jgi:hypothetical protein
MSSKPSSDRNMAETPSGVRAIIVSASGDGSCRQEICPFCQKDSTGRRSDDKIGIGEFARESATVDGVLPVGTVADVFLFQSG